MFPGGYCSWGASVSEPLKFGFVFINRYNEGTWLLKLTILYYAFIFYFLLLDMQNIQFFFFKNIITCFSKAIFHKVLITRFFWMMALKYATFYVMLMQVCTHQFLAQWTEIISKVAFFIFILFFYSNILLLYFLVGTLRSLLNELACLTVFGTVKQGSLFNRDLRILL